MIVRQRHGSPFRPHRRHRPADHVQRSSGIFTLVLDGGESILTVATRVPQAEIGYYYNHARRKRRHSAAHRLYRRRHLAARPGHDVASDGQIQLRLIPRISYFSVDRPGAIDFTEAATELIVPNGQPLSLGGPTATCTRSRARFSAITIARAAAKPD